MYRCKARKEFKNAIESATEMKGMPLDPLEMVNIRLRVIMETLLEIKEKVNELDRRCRCS